MTNRRSGTIILAMEMEVFRRYCLSFPHATEQVQWEDDLVLKVGGRMFAIIPLEPGGYCIAFKTSPEEFVELLERPGMTAAPYLARAHWVAVEDESALEPEELRRLLRKSYDLVFARLPKKTQAALRA